VASFVYAVICGFSHLVKVNQSKQRITILSSFLKTQIDGEKVAPGCLVNLPFGQVPFHQPVI
jgi:hypothetical protein